MLDNPAFAPAYRASADAALAFADANPAFQAMMLDMGGFFLCFVALYMDATTGITHRALRGLAGGGGGIVLSAGRATAILWKLRGGKFVEPAPGGGFVPTRILRDGMRDRMRLDFEALRLLEPGVAAVLARFDDERFVAAIIRHLGGDMSLGSTDRPDDAGLTFISQLSGRAAGVLIIYALLVAARDQASFPPSGVTTASVSSIARRFGVSRRHVLRQLRDMEAMGFTTCRDDQWVLLPALARALCLFQGLMLIRLLRAAHEALAEG